ncbi:hypothetical protein H2199_002410 [Coniosporium tulheliwenetii]|uniref:Uncharacterized protein n=1 Tax=Coniosporium tulheliwenetii TaxID=3383036 RepID=A0ACC2ZGF3_9PEZI|nr:hypothetical protein H2199_002410 [Cladosporium sp. JES 115]
MKVNNSTTDLFQDDIENLVATSFMLREAGMRRERKHLLDMAPRTVAADIVPKPGLEAEPATQGSNYEGASALKKKKKTRLATFVRKAVPEIPTSPLPVALPPMEAYHSDDSPWTSPKKPRKSEKRAQVSGDDIAEDNAVSESTWLLPKRNQKKKNTAVSGDPPLDDLAPPRLLPPPTEKAEPYHAKEHPWCKWCSQDTKSEDDIAVINTKVEIMDDDNIMTTYDETSRKWRIQYKRNGEGNEKARKYRAIQSKDVVILAEDCSEAEREPVQFSSTEPGTDSLRTRSQSRDKTYQATENDRKSRAVVVEDDIEVEEMS